MSQVAVDRDEACAANPEPEVTDPEESREARSVASVPQEPEAVPCLESLPVPEIPDLPDVEEEVCVGAGDEDGELLELSPIEVRVVVEGAAEAPPPLQVEAVKVDEEADEEDEGFDFREMAVGAMRHAEDLVRRILSRMTWKVCHFHSLPRWLQDNDFIWQGYRPPLPSFWDCIKSIFSIHTETGNIWTHMLGCIAFLGVGAFFLSCTDADIRGEDKLVFGAFFTGACVCLGLSTCFHTFLCHSEWAGQLFSKLDYVGIALLIMGSFVPWLHYSFYCDAIPRIIYLSVEIVLGLLSITVSLWPRFGEPKFRPLRAGLFLSFGLSGVVPAVHYSLAEGWINALSQASLGWLILMGLLYVLGTMFYALRIPERFFPGKFDIWFQSHQIFHVFVVAAAFVHYHGISEMAIHRLSVGECPVQAAEGS